MLKVIRFIVLTAGFYLGFSLYCNAQNQPVIDSLTALLPQSPDTLKAKLYNDLAFQYRTVNSDKTIELAQKALDIASQSGFQKQLPRSYNFIGLAYYNDGNYPEALGYFQNAIDFARVLQDSVELGFALQIKSGVYRWMGDFEKAMESGIESQKLFERIGDLRGMAYSYSSLAGLYLDQNEPEEALEYIDKAIALKENSPDSNGLPTFQLNKANILVELKQYGKAFLEFKKAIKGYEQIGHQRGLMISNIRMGEAYLKTGLIEQTRACVERAVKIHEKYNIDTEVALLTIMQARINLVDGQRGEALSNLHIAERYALASNRKKELSEIYQMLSIIYQSKNKYSKSLDYYKNYSQLKDSLFSIDLSRKIGSITAEIELNKKQLELDRLIIEQESDRAKLRFANRSRIGLGIITALLFFLSLFGYWNYRQKKYGNDLLVKKNEKIEAQSKVLQSQAMELSEAQKVLQNTNEKLEEIVEKRTIELIRSNSELERYAYVASHDLKEPLRMITSFSQLLQKELTKEKPDPGKFSDYLSYLISGTRNMNNLIEDLLLFSKLSASPEETFEMVILEDILTSVEENLQSSINSTGAIIKYTELPKRIFGIEVKLVQLFQNLISNAIKFRREDVPCQIEISASENPDLWEFRVSDNGIGIDEKHHKKIFELFRKLHSKLIFEGSGIGLSMCKRIVEIHNGKIWVTSILGGGSIFYFTLPKQKSNQLNAAQSEKELKNSHQHAGKQDVPASI